MNGIAAIAKQWLAGEKTAPGSTEITSHHLIESLLAEIVRLEAVNAGIAGEVLWFKADGAKDVRRTVAEECAVICETADYVTRNYGCAREIRMKFGLPTQKQ